MRDYITEHLQLALEQLLHEKENAIANQDFAKAADYRDTYDLVKKALAKLPWPNIWTDEQCVTLNKLQQDNTRHPYTCGINSTHKPLVATRQGWKCPDCSYRQAWSHYETGENQ
jgi:hypothetical protein